MEALIKNITELFFVHDCVVVPRLGGFIANYEPAYFDAKNNLMVPPRKKFLFNRFLLHNDGLLAHHLAADLRISYNDAVLQIDSFVEAIFTQLKKNNTCTIDLIGTIYYDQNNLLQFNAASKNYMLGAYGLPVVKALPKIAVPILEDTTPVIPIGTTIGSETLNKEDTDTVKVVAINSKRTTSNAKWWIAAAMLPVAFYSAWIPMKTDLFRPNGNFHYSDLNPFSFEKTVKMYTPIEGIAIQMDSLQYAFIAAEPITSSPETFEDAATTEIVAVKVKVAPTGNYHLIGGCFSSEDNASNYVTDLQSKGFSAQIIDQAGGLYRVSVASFDNNDLANSERASLLNEHNISTWILKKTVK